MVHYLKVIGLTMCIDVSVSTKTWLTVFIDFYVILIQPINIGEQERQGMMFMTIVQVKELNGLQYQLSFSYNRYEKIENLTNNLKILQITTH